MPKTLSLLCLSQILTMFEVANECLKIKTKQGVLRGKEWKTWKGREFFGFTAIPYAKPPMGELRFKPPVPLESWEGVLDATKAHSVCPQVYIFTEDCPIIGDEDCLYLNVYTPQLPHPDKVLLPVMVYIHGGSYIMGSAKADWVGPEILLDKDIVLVTINYRLGAFGFLSTGDEVVPGNNGLKDQNLALKWVYDNIAEFGGHPGRITLFGNSAGAACTHFHMFSPLSRDLIQRAIVQSGSALASYAFSSKKDAVRNAFKLGTYLNITTSSSEELIDSLRKADSCDIVKAEAKFVTWDNDTTMPFRTVVEHIHDGAFLMEEPMETLQSGKVADVPLMTGIVSHEAAFKSANIFGKPELVNKLEKYFDQIVPLSFGIVSDIKTSVKNIKQFYFGAVNGSLTKSGVTDMYTDGWFLTGANTTVRSHYQYSKKPIYNYLFDYRGSVSYASLFGDPSHDYGVCHTDDMLYLLSRSSLFPTYKPSASDTQMSDVITTLWTNFAATGNPTPDESPVKWNPIESDNLEFLHIKSHSDIKMADNLYKSRADFWGSLHTGKIETDHEM